MIAFSGFKQVKRLLCLGAHSDDIEIGAGATVLRGPMGFGKSSHLHTAKILRLSMDLPIVIEIVDSEEKVNAFLPVLDEIMGGGLVTLDRAKVIRYQDREKK